MLNSILPWLFGTGAAGALAAVAFFLIRRSAQKDQMLQDADDLIDEIANSNKEAAQSAKDIANMPYDDVVDGLRD